MPLRFDNNELKFRPQWLCLEAIGASGLHLQDESPYKAETNLVPYCIPSGT